jgi:superfamily II DNA helicase RecQ
VLYVVLDKQTPLIIILPTSRGKSLLFTLPACIEGVGVIVVIIPYRALIKDLVSRICKYGVNYIE